MYHIVERTHPGRPEGAWIEVREDWPGDTAAQAVELYLAELVGDEDLGLFESIEVRVSGHGVFKYRVDPKLVSLTRPTSWEHMEES